MMTVFVLKLLCIPGILLANLLFGLLPYCFVDNRRRIRDRRRTTNGIDHFRVTETKTSDLPTEVYQNEKCCCFPMPLSSFLSKANCFSAGVFLATCFVGLLPSVEMKYAHILMLMKNSTSHSSSDMMHSTESSSHGQAQNYPLPEASICIGFFAVWILELVAQGIMTHFQRSSQNLRDMLPTSSDTGFHENSSSSDSELSGDHNKSKTSSKNKNLGSKEHLLPHNHQETISHTSDHQRESLNCSEMRPVAYEQQQQTTLFKSILLTIALSSHSILEGIGFGLLDQVNQVFNMAIAMLIHECLCAFSLGIRLANGTSRCASLIMLLVFSLLIPIGISIGMILHRGAEATIVGQFLSMFLQGMAAGTFIYVVFFEILPAEMNFGGGHEAHSHLALDQTRSQVTEDMQNSHSNKTMKLLFCFIGFLSIALLRLYHAH